MDKLPFEVALQVLDLLPVVDLCSAVCVDRYWNVIASVKLYCRPQLRSIQQLYAFTQLSELLQSYIQHLDFSGVHQYVNDRMLRNHLQHLTNLKSINLSKCTHLTPAFIFSLIQHNVYKIHTLILANCTLSNDILKYIGIATHHQLRFLDLSNTMIKPCVSIDTANHLDSMFDHSFTDTHAAPKLRYLDLSYCIWVNSQTVENIAHSLPQLEHIVLQWCNQIRRKSIDVLVQSLSLLTTMDLRHMEIVGDTHQAFRIFDHTHSLKKILFTCKTLSTEIVS